MTCPPGAQRIETNPMKKVYAEIKVNIMLVIDEEADIKDVLDTLEPVFSLHSQDADLLDATVKEVVVTDVK